MPSPRGQSDDARDARHRARAIQTLLQSTLSATDPAMIRALRHLDGLANPWTARCRAIHLRCFFDWCVARELNVLDIEREDAKIYFAHLPRRLAPSTRFGRIAAARAFFEDAVRTRPNPFKGIAGNTVTNVHDTPALTIAEISDVLHFYEVRRREARLTIAEKRNVHIFKSMMRLGPRRGEVVVSCWGDLIVESGRSQWRFLGKGGTYANTALSADVERDLLSWRDELETDLGRPVQSYEPIFPACSPRGQTFRHLAAAGRLRPMQPPTLTAIFKRMFKDGNVRARPRLAAHSARATSITLAHEAGVADRSLMQQSRHRSVANLYRYIRTEPGVPPAESWTMETHEGDLE